MKDEQIEALKRFNDMQAKIVAEYVQTSVIKELETIKAEICQRCNDALFGSASGIVDNHISELKGENKC